MIKYEITIDERPDGLCHVGYKTCEDGATCAEREVIWAVDAAFRAWMLERTGRRPDDDIDIECREISERRARHRRGGNR